MKIKCPNCGLEKWSHVHNCAHGLSGTHMAGSERYECKCGKAIYVVEGTKLGFKFIEDKL